MPLFSRLVKPEQPCVLQLPVSAISPNPNQPRRTFSNSALEEMALSIRELGASRFFLRGAFYGGGNSRNVFVRHATSRRQAKPAIEKIFRNAVSVKRISRVNGL